MSVRFVFLFFSLTLSGLDLVFGQNFGPYWFPSEKKALKENGTVCCNEQSASIMIAPHNDSYFFVNMEVYGDYWFAFAFADSARITGKMWGADAWVFANFQGDAELAVLEYNLGNHTLGDADPDVQQNIIETNLYIGTAENNPYYSINLLREYDTGSRNDFKVTLAGNLGLLWAFGSDLYIHSLSGHSSTLREYRILDLAGTTVNPTPSPSYGPTKAPSVSPTTKTPTIPGATPNPTTNPTAQPTPGPTTQTANPSLGPTQVPTLKPTRPPLGVNQTKYPSEVPTETPRPTKAPTQPTTAQPTESPLVVGQTKAPSLGPTEMPTEPPTSVPTDSPTPSPLSVSELSSKRGFMDENAIYLIVAGAIFLFCCFCIALICFHRRQKARTEDRASKRKNMLEVEKFKQEQGMEIGQGKNNADANPTVVVGGTAAEYEDEEDEEEEDGRRQAYTVPRITNDEDDEEEEEEIPDPRTRPKRRRKKRKKKRRRPRPRSSEEEDSEVRRPPIRNSRDEEYKRDEDDAEEYGNGRRDRDRDRGRRGSDDDDDGERGGSRNRNRGRKKRKPRRKRRAKPKSKFGDGGGDNSARYGDDDRGIVRSKAKKRRKPRYDEDSD